MEPPGLLPTLHGISEDATDEISSLCKTNTESELEYSSTVLQPCYSCSGWSRVVFSTSGWWA